MAIDLAALMFTGTRFGRAKAKRTDFRRRAHPPIFSVVSPVAGKQWTVDTAEGWWRDFCSLDVADQKQVVAWVRRRGFIAPETERQEFTDHWPVLQGALRTIESAWEPPIADGDSEITDFRKLTAAVVAYQEDLEVTRRLRELRVVFDSAGRTVRQAQTLPGYMIFSALTGLQSAIDKQSTAPMRRCLWCQSWFYRPRIDARYDSPSCRARANEHNRIAAE